MAQKIYNKFGFNSSWTPTDHQLFVTQLESPYVREKSLQKRIEMVDKALHRHPDSRATLETSGRLHIAVMVAAVWLRLWLPLWLLPLPSALAAQRNVNGSLNDGEKSERRSRELTWRFPILTPEQTHAEEQQQCHEQR